MSSIGNPLLGDQSYGSTPRILKPLLVEEKFSRQALHAARLSFIHPVTADELQFSSEVPRDMAALIGRLNH
jgi:23S rRNA pseudouridine1911/1915/1917 synthase